MSSTSGTNNNHTSNGNRTWNSTTGSSAVLTEQTNTRNTNTFVKQRNDVICHRDLAQTTTILRMEIEPGTPLLEARLFLLNKQTQETRTRLLNREMMLYVIAVGSLVISLQIV